VKLSNQSKYTKGVCKMPGGDKTGPSGSGPKTGRGLGYCANNDQPGYSASQPAQGFGQGFGWRGRRRGQRNRFNAGFGSRRGRGSFAIENQEIDALKAETQELRGVLQQILDKLDKLGS
jgi:hypothetical protein